MHHSSLFKNYMINSLSSALHFLQIFLNLHHQTCKDLEGSSQIPTCLGQHKRLHPHPLMDHILPLHQLHLLNQLLLLQYKLLERWRRLFLVAVLKDVRLLDEVQL